MKKFFIRTASALVFAVFMFGGILWCPLSFSILMSIILIGSMNEFYNISQPKRENLTAPLTKKTFIIISCIIVYWISFLLSSEPVRAMPDVHNLFKAFFQVLLMQRDSALAMNVIVPVLIFIFFAAELFSKSENPFVNIGWNVLAAFYLLVPLILTNNIYFTKGGIFLLLVFCIIWFYDSAAYVFGSLVGKRKLFERVSPKKTTEGMVIGVALTIAVLYGFLQISQLAFLFEKLSHKQWLILAFIIVIAATFGDLVESLLKRSLNIKDSGSIMPGHGGFLDRFDAYFFTVPFVALTLWIFAKADGLLLMIEYMNQ